MLFNFQTESVNNELEQVKDKQNKQHESAKHENEPHPVLEKNSQVEVRELVLAEDLGFKTEVKEGNG